MKPFADWSVRNKLLIPVTATIVVGGLIMILTFVQMTKSIRDESLQHILHIDELRAAVLDLTGEYREFVVESEPSVAQEIEDAKDQVGLALKWLTFHEHRRDISQTTDVSNMKGLVQSLLANGDSIVSIQTQIVENLETLEEWRVKITDTVSAARSVIEEEIQEAHKNKNMTLLMSASMPELHSLGDIDVAVWRLVSETSQFVLRGEDETVAKLLASRTAFDSSLATFAATAQNFPDEKPFIAKIESVAQALFKISDHLVDLTKQRAESLDDTEGSAERLEDRLAAVVAKDTLGLDTLFDKQRNIVSATIIIVLMLVILALAISSQRIKVALAGLTQATVKLRRGDHEARAPVRGRDELGLLADSFNHMATDLQENIKQREIAENELKIFNTGLEKRVEERTAELKTARDEAEAASLLKSQLVTTMSHELRTPLTSIVGSLGMLSKNNVRDDPDVFSNLLDVARRNSQQLSKLVDDILDVDKLEAGTIGLQMERLDLSELVSGAVELNAGYAIELDVTINMADSPDNVMILGDQMRLTQVMANLLSNAAKFSPKGGNITVSLSQNGELATVNVSDEGPGIPTEIRDSVFEKFVRGENIDTRTQGGTGLGLSISKSLIEQHGGTIGFYSEKDGRTTFFFTLPVLT